jgi:hypothetical protein
MAKYSEKRMFEKLSEFSSSRKKNSSLKKYPDGGEFLSIARRQKKLAQSLINSGNIDKHFPELYEYYLSKENSQRVGGPLNMEQIVIEKLRKEPNFLQVMQSKKFSQQVPQFDEGGLFGKRRKKKSMGPDYGQPGYLDDIWNTTHMIDPITGQVNTNEDWKTKVPLVVNQPGQGFELPGDELTQEEKWARQEATYPIVTQEDVDWSAGMAKLDQTLSDLKAEREALQLKNQEWAAQQWQDKLTKRKEDFDKKGKHDALEPFETIPKYEYDSRINANPDYLEELRQQGYFVNIKDNIVELYPATEIQSRIWDNGLRTGEIVNKLGVGTAESIKESFGTIMDQADQYHAYQTKNFLLDLMKKGMSRDAAIDYLVNKKGLGQSRESLEKLYNQDFNEVEKWAKSFVAYSDEYEKPYEQGQDLDIVNRWNDNDIITLAKDRDFIDSHGANIDIVSPNYSNSPDYGAQVLYKLRTGKWGWMPKSNQLVRLDSDESYKALITEPSQLDVQSMNKLKDYTSLTPQAFGQKYSPTLGEAEKRWKDGRVAVQIASEDSWRPNKMFVTDPNKKDAFGNPSGQFYQYSFQVPTGGVDAMTGELRTKTVTPDEMAGQTVYMTQEEADKYNKAMLGDNMEEFYKHPLFYAPGVIAAAPFAAGAFGSAMAYAPFSTLPGLTVGNALGAYGAYETLKPQGFAEQAYDAFQKGDTDEAWKNTAFSALGLLPAVKPLVGSYRALNALRTPGANAILKTPGSYSLLAKTPSGSNLLAGNTNLANTTEMFPGFTSRLNRFTGANNLGEYKLLRQTAPQLGESQVMQLANQTPLTKFLGSGTTSLPAFSNQALQLSNGLQSQLSVPSLKQGFNLQNTNAANGSQTPTVSWDDVNRDQENYYYTQLSGKDEYDAYLKRFPNLIQENQNLGKQNYFGEEGFLPGETLEQAQQRVFDQATDFSQKWMFKDPLKYEDLSTKLTTNHNDLVSLKQNKYYNWNTYAERPILDTYLRDVKGLSDTEVQDLYTGLDTFRTYNKPFLKPSEAFGRFAGNDATALTQKYDNLEALRQEMHSSGYFDKAISQEDPTVKLAYNRGLKLAQQEQQLYDDSFSLYDEMEANMDPDFRSKIGELYTLSGRPMPQYMHGFNRENIGTPAIDIGGTKVSMWNPLFDAKRTTLVDVDPTTKNFSNLSFDDQDYLLKNYPKLAGVRTGDSTITLGSAPVDLYFLAKPKQVFNQTKAGYYEQTNPFEITNPLTWKNNTFNPWFKPKYNWIEPEGTYSYRDPNSDGTAKLINRSLQRANSLQQVGGVNAHEIGHDMQPMYDNWINLIQKYDQDAAYYTGHSDNILAETYNEAMVNPVPAKEVTKADGTVEKDYDYQTWLSSPGELHSDLQKARFKFATQIMKEQNINMDDAIKQLKQMENTGDDELYQYYLDSGFGNLNKHFKPEATYETKKSLMQILPQVGITIGVGGAAGTMMNNGEEQQTTNNRYGGSIKKLSKFIRK